ncbi:MAG TPA: sensor domain-containing diguanylate cyclase [Candidatus Methylomirabilis sp.]|nr:sensor domain-containing diguanylate cyclase [Candidatus Methylomirabilis sp.]
MQDFLNISGQASLVRRFIPVFSVLLCTVIISLLLTLGAVEVLSAARGYMTGERLWSTARHDAIYSLTLYGQTREPAYFNRFRQALTIPLSDREARIELDKQQFDYAKAAAWLRRGGSHPEDIRGLILLYRCCAEYPQFARPVELWRESDAYLVQLERLGDTLHAEISSAAPARKRIDALLEQVRAVDAGVRPLEQAFDATLDEAAQWLKSTLAWAIYAIISLLIVLGIYLSSRVLGRIRRAEGHYRLLINAFAHTADGIMILDTARRIVAVNHAFTTITGYAPEEVIGEMFIRPKTMKIPGPPLFAVWADTRTAGRWEGEVWNVRKNGDLYPMRLSLSAVHDGRRGAVDHYVAVFSDISPYKADEERLKHLATHDPLTGLPNRAEFDRCFREAIERARRHGQRVSLLYIDLDGFKPVNDTYGHAVGDALLRTLGARMKQVMRETDIVARVGGDEFSVLLADLDDVSRSYIVACKLLDMLSQPVVTKRGTHHVGASIGISTYPDDGDDPQTLLRRADAAMYRVKQGGRGGVAFYSVHAESQTQSATPGAAQKILADH